MASDATDLECRAQHIADAANAFSLSLDPQRKPFSLDLAPPKAILVLSHMYPRDYHPAGGAFVHEQVKTLRSAGYDVRVLSGEPYWVNARSPLKWLRSLRGSFERVIPTSPSASSLLQLS